MTTTDYSAITPKAQVKTISKSIDTTLQPIDLYHGLTQSLGKTNTMLLESSEISSRENVKSILMIDAAIRIESNQEEVRLQALTHNGLNALIEISSQLTTLGLNAHFSPEQKTTLVTFESQTTVVDEDARLKQSSPIEALRIIQQCFKKESQSDFSIFICGLFSFDFIATFEQLPDVPMGENTCPDYVFYLAESLLVTDHQRNNQRLLCNHFSGENQKQTYFELARRFEQIEKTLQSITHSTLISAPPTKDLSQNQAVNVDIEDKTFETTVAQLKQNIIQGDVFQVVPSRTFSLSCHSPLESYRQLKQSNPSPYMFYMQDENFVLFGASPESALKYTANTNKVLLYPIAGTRPRGKKPNGEIDLDLDARIEAELKLDEKEVSEHMMLVDLARNDIARIALPGTTHVPRLLSVDRYSQVMHLVSCVEGNLRHDLDALHAYQACMNMGTLTGAPKIKASQLIREVEKKRRGSYGGAVGYLNGNGDMDTCIVIRSAFVKNNQAYVQAGAGIVYDSVPEMEAQETENKAKAVINAVLKANQIVSDQNRRDEELSHES